MGQNTSQRQLEVEHEDAEVGDEEVKTREPVVFGDIGHWAVAMSLDSEVPVLISLHVLGDLVIIVVEHYDHDEDRPQGE